MTAGVLISVIYGDFGERWQTVNFVNGEQNRDPDISELSNCYYLRESLAAPFLESPNE